VRILYLNPCGQMGGAETSLVELLASVRAAKPDWQLSLALGEDGPLADKARALGLQVILAPFPRSLARLGDAQPGRLGTLLSLLKAAGGIALYVRRLAAIVSAVRPEIIHSNGFKMHFLGAWIGTRHAALVWHIHDYVRTRPIMSRLLRLLAKRCTAAIVNSRSVATDLSALAPNLQVVPIYNAIDLKRFAPDGKRLDLDALAGLSPAPPGTVRVGLVATFARWKGHKVFLQALSRLPSDAPIRGYIIGSPIYQTSGSQWSLRDLQQEAERLGLAGRIGFTGFVDDAAAAMRSLDVVTHASTEPEPFGMVIIEGMACGKAVIASQGGGAVELFEDGKDAVGHAPGDVDALAEQISRLASDGNLRAALGAAGRARVEQLFGGRRLARQLIAVYRGSANDKDFDSSLCAEISAHSD
jgi:glycosyltransferase involved in cell wall biosynthesis